jgi:steroid 5-alpha reductase family enzyme
MASVMGISYIDPRSWALNACLSIWAFRLAGHIGIRHTGEDYRYVSMRERMNKCGTAGYYILSFLLIFMLQASFSLLVNYTVFRTTALSSAQSLV